MNQDILFVIGLPRSGTKLLRDLLNRHTDVALFPNETHFFPVLKERLHRYVPLSDWNNFRRLHREIANSAFFRRMSARGSGLEARAWFDAMNGDDFSAVLRGLFDCYRRTSGALIVGDKTPSYVNHVGMLAETLPGARFLHIVRDPRDQALSMRAAWGKNLVRAAARWKAGVRKCRADARSSQAAYHELHYEDLLRDPRATLTAVCDFLGIRFSEEMLSLKQASENLGDARGEISILAGNLDKWRTRLRDVEVRRIESVAGECMLEFGYVPALATGDRDLGFLEDSLLRASDAANLLAFTAREEGGLWPGLVHLWHVWRVQPDEPG